MIKILFQLRWTQTDFNSIRVNQYWVYALTHFPYSDSDGEGGGVLTGWTKEFARQLQYTREVTMGTSNENITDDLLSAEQKLAKVRW